MRSISSQGMSTLLTWRNPSGTEKNWLGTYQNNPQNYWDYPGKVAATEIGLLFLTSVAVVETVAYAILSLASYLVSNKSHNFCLKLLESSSFTVLWSANALITTPFFNNVMTQEPFARYWTKLCNPNLGRIFFRREDEQYINDWNDHHTPSGAQPLMRMTITAD